MPSIVPETPDAQVDITPRAYLHEPCDILATAQWWREHRGVCGGCETTEGWSPLFSDTAPDALDSLPIAALLHARLASWFGDDRQSFLVSDLVPVVAQIVAEFQHNAVELARKAALAESRAEEAEFHVEQLRDARDSAERRIERTERLLDGWEQDGPDDVVVCLLIQRVREALGESRGEVGTGAGEGAPGQDTGSAWVTRSADCPEAPAQAHLPACNCVPGICTDEDECCESHECPGLCGDHEWLDRPESDTRECLICGAEVAG